ncbi:unnamed protein product [Sphagnum balticum]
MSLVRTSFVGWLQWTLALARPPSVVVVVVGVCVCVCRNACWSCLLAPAASNVEEEELETEQRGKDMEERSLRAVKKKKKKTKQLLLQCIMVQ